MLLEAKVTNFIYLFFYFYDLIIYEKTITNHTLWCTKIEKISKSG